MTKPKRKRDNDNMSDREFGGNDELSLPKATVQKIVSEILQSEPGMTFAKDSRDVLIDCCVEFITLISSEANEIAEKEAKKTIACEHVKHALEELDFGAYVPAVLEVAENYKNTQQHREKKQNKIEQSGMTDEQLVAMQEEMFRKAANSKYSNEPQA